MIEKSENIEGIVQLRKNRIALFFKMEHWTNVLGIITGLLLSMTFIIPWFFQVKYVWTIFSLSAIPFGLFYCFFFVRRSLWLSQIKKLYTDHQSISGQLNDYKSSLGNYRNLLTGILFSGVVVLVMGACGVERDHLLGIGAVLMLGSALLLCFGLVTQFNTEECIHHLKSG